MNDTRKKRREFRPAVDTLEGRVALSAGGAMSAAHHQVQAERQLLRQQRIEHRNELRLQRIEHRQLMQQQSRPLGRGQLRQRRATFGIASGTPTGASGAVVGTTSLGNTLSTRSTGTGLTSGLLSTFNTPGTGNQGQLLAARQAGASLSSISARRANLPFSVQPVASTFTRTAAPSTVTGGSAFFPNSNNFASNGLGVSNFSLTNTPFTNSLVTSPVFTSGVNVSSLNSSNPLVGTFAPGGGLAFNVPANIANGGTVANGLLGTVNNAPLSNNLRGTINGVFNANGFGSSTLTSTSPGSFNSNVSPTVPGLSTTTGSVFNTTSSAATTLPSLGQSFVSGTSPFLLGFPGSTVNSPAFGNSLSMNTSSLPVVLV